MPNILAALLAAAHLLTFSPAKEPLTTRLRSGEWLRFHVVAQDDTPEMQHVKASVRDAVRSCFLSARQNDDSSMYAQAHALLPEMTAAAIAAAQQEGFVGDVEVSLGQGIFRSRAIDGVRIPAGAYPSLVIRLGDAQGANWWGLLDPELSLTFACASTADQDATVIWDWSWNAIIRALFGCIREGA